MVIHLANNISGTTWFYIFSRHQIRISAKTLDILTEAFRDFPRFLQANAEILKDATITSVRILSNASIVLLRALKTTDTQRFYSYW